MVDPKFEDLPGIVSITLENDDQFLEKVAFCQN